MNKRKLALAALVLVLLGASYGLYHHQQQQEKPLTLYGNVDIRTVNLAFRVGGRVAELNVDEGDTVQAGQPLAMLDAAPYQNAQHQAQANLASAQAQLQLAQEGYRQEEIAQVRSQVVQSQAAYDYANNFYQRQQGLWDKRAISANMLDDARTSRNQALAALQAAKDKLSQFERGNRPQEIAAAQAAVAQAEAGLAQAELDKQDAELLAPSPGVILTRAAEKGSMLAAGSTVFTLSLTRPVWVRAYVSEKDLGRVVPGSHMLIYTDGRPNQPYRGKVGFVSPSAEFTPKSVETEDLRTDLVYRLRIVVNDPDDGLRQGMPVTLRVEDARTEDANRAHEPVRHD
ncbi:secretion protein HlyD [Pectobacterium aroidearum]|uniref:secretion protein HlyD n=1 Tax=Pectobacterium aroidearum TaxID=1201031 RepID=UPI002114C438|nr:secretion protein HlyD [Pectobacterium aroidearum]UUE43544.1 secretion protein HlyD [Pectobacterium aroidearum]UUE47763.1 secretion protein HlyD [Pectobacterium aroidearum]UUE51968.1 secretion protein HlyD [Pectobacterium aroidearum]UUE60378.1 secretion protein HlyD [Pectobacterium aroidearum]UUE64601.1 secretion protein HlyD [Pectobacterium aroidearum]